MRENCLKRSAASLMDSKRAKCFAGPVFYVDKIKVLGKFVYLGYFVIVFETPVTK